MCSCNTTFVMASAIRCISGSLFQGLKQPECKLLRLTIQTALLHSPFIFMAWYLFPIFFLVSCGGVRMGSLVMSVTIWPIVPAPSDR
jgi:hypothetical protein